MKHPIRRRLMYLGFLTLQGLVRWLPLAAARAVGRALGTAAYVLVGAQRRLTLDHLSYAFGDTLSPAKRRRIARRVFANLGQSVMEWLLLPRLSDRAVQELIICEGLEYVRQALAKGNGAIMVGAHFGNWELGPLYLKTQGFEGGVLARRLRYPEYESFLIGLRGSRGVPTFARGSIKEVAKVLRANQLIGMMPDQDMDSLEGVFVQFFGHPAYTPAGPAALSLMTGAPILPCALIREGARFRFVIEPPIQSPSAADRVQAVTVLTQAWSNALESYIRRYPEQWVWMHRRWKTQPAAAQSTEHRAQSTQQVPHLALSYLLAASCYVLAAVLQGCGKPTASVSSKPSVSADAASPAATQQMSGLILTGYASDGSKRWDLEGQGASMDGNVVTIHRPDATGYDVGRTAYLTASLAQVNQTNRHVRLEHDVTIHTSDGLWFTAPVLHWMPDKDEATTDQPVRIETEHMLLRGREMRGRMELKEFTIFKDIELVLNPSDRDLLLPGADPAKPGAAKQVTITCDGPLSFDYGKNIATFEQNVHVKDPSGDLYSDKLVAYLDPKTHTIRYAEAIGRVRMHQNQNTALSDRAVYEPAISKITLVGKPSLLVYPSSETDASPSLSFGGLVAGSEPD